jgi:biotin carboxyl carrier protein
MKKYFLNINNSKEAKELDIIDHQTFTFNGESFDFYYRFITPNVLVVRVNGENYVVTASSDIEADTELRNTDFNVDISSTNYKLICKNELDVLIEKFSQSRSDKGFKKDLISPMPGAIVKINVKTGDIVKKGQVLVVLEAMKMENELKATGESKVAQICIEEKSSVDKGQVLIKLEPVT